MLLEFQIHLFVACVILTYITQYSETPPYGHLVITAAFFGLPGKNHPNIFKHITHQNDTIGGCQFC